MSGLINLALATGDCRCEGILVSTIAEMGSSWASRQILGKVVVVSKMR